MKVIVLAAGRGSRINSVTQFHPKCLTVYNGKTLLENTLNNLSDFFSNDQIIIIGGYKKEMLSNFATKILVNENWETTNIMASLCVSEEFLEKEDCIVIYSDIYFHSEAIASILKSKEPSVLNVVNWKNIWEKRFSNPLDDLENFTFNRENYLTNIGGRANTMNEIMGQFGGIFSLNTQIWSVIKDFGSEIMQMDTTSCLKKLIDQGQLIKVINYDGQWAEIDREEDIYSF